MFGFGAGKPTSPTSQSTMTRKASKKDVPSTAPYTEPFSSPESLEPAIDGPPSPERIRAYTEQMKRSSIFGNNSRTNTFSSASSSFRSRDSTYASTDSSSLSRKSSGRSNTGNMPRSDRPESTQIFGSIFSRGGRKSRRDNVLTEGSAKDHYYGRTSNRRGTVTSTFPLGQESRRRQLISGPYNFQHVTHTRQEQLPNLEQKSPMELVSEFSALRASQAPTNGELKGIRVQDLHFDNFSSEALSVSSSHEEPPAPSQRQRTVLRKPVRSSQPQPMAYAKSYDNLRVAPPRPPRSPLSPVCPVDLPTRTSSRQASVLFETFDPHAIPSVNAYSNNGFRKPLPLILDSQTPVSPSEYSSDLSSSHALTTPGDEAWPLTASPSGNFGELADVQEEEEEVGSRRSRISVTSTELRASQSVPSLQFRSREQSHMKSDSCVSTILGQSPTRESSAPKRPLSAGFNLDDDWERDIDYCYEHEIEADCDYQWDQGTTEINVEKASPVASQPPLALHLEDDDRSVYHGRFRPSLLIPSAFDVPELSPMSNISAVSSHPHTPQMHNSSRLGHVRSPSYASSFKESHGFHLSPTLLIPADFQSQMDQDAAYDHHFGNINATSGTIYQQEPYNVSMSPVDESSSSISYRSSNFSRGSARSSSSTRISATNSRGSQDSVMLLSRATSYDQAHRSIGSQSSLPDLIPSSIRKSDGTHDNVESLMGPQGMSSDDSDVSKAEATAPTSQLTLPGEASKLSPITESPFGPMVHGRKISAPVVSQTVREFKSRPRAGTSASITNMAGGKKRGSYNLFPQT
ncbi:hypothetical protein B0J14DRAFT_469086 [Halenospora varia]|nr:hypothetical protein B0J14DRAFT_469086 [Halenospora varia]